MDSPLVVRSFVIFTLLIVAAAVPQFPIPEDVSAKPAIKPKDLDQPFINALLKSTMNKAANMLSPCNLYDQVNTDMQKSLQSKAKSKSQMINGPDVDRKITRQMVIHKALPALNDGINLIRTAFVLKNTTNITMFIDRNEDGVFNDTILANFTQFYIHAGNEHATQVLFTGLMKTEPFDALPVENKTMPGWQFLVPLGLTYHPRQLIGMDKLAPGELEVIMKKRVGMAEMLKDQGTYYDDDEEYLSNILTVAFNGPENQHEVTEMLTKTTKLFAHKMVQNDAVKDDYENTCDKIKEETDLMLALGGFIF